MFGVACNHFPWIYIRSDYVGRDMPSLPLGKTHGKTTSVMEFPHVSWPGNTGGRRRAWHAIIAMDNI